MNRRTVLKISGILGLTGAVSVAGYKYIESPKPVPAYFKQNESLIAELAEHIIPGTDTPGAKEAMVHLFIINILLNCASERDKRTFAGGLEDLSIYSKHLYQKDFLKCSVAEQHEIVSYFEKKGRLYPGLLGKVQKKILGEPFFSLLKKYTINGYCTSFLGATKNFRYDYIPVTFDACIPYETNEPSWATK